MEYPACHGRVREFESHRPCHSFEDLSDVTPKIPIRSFFSSLQFSSPRRSGIPHHDGKHVWGDVDPLPSLQVGGREGCRGARTMIFSANAEERQSPVA